MVGPDWSGPFVPERQPVRVVGVGGDACLDCRPLEEGQQGCGALVKVEVELGVVALWQPPDGGG